MSRHRDFHNMDHDDYDDEPDYGSSVSSYTDEMPLSRSMENEFMFRRGGNTPKMSQFFGRTNSVSSVPEEDEDAGNEADSDDSSSTSEGGRRHSSGSSLIESLNAEEAAKLATCLIDILDIVGENIPEIQSKFLNQDSSKMFQIYYVLSQFAKINFSFNIVFAYIHTLQKIIKLSSVLQLVTLSGTFWDLRKNSEF